MLVRIIILNILLSFILFGQNCFGQNKDSIIITNISLDSNGIVKWRVLSPSGRLIQTIESFENNNWKVVYSYTSTPIISARIGKNDTCYTNNSTHLKLHWGKNKFRIKVISPIAVTSKEIEFYNQKPEIQNSPPFKVKDKFSFNKKTSYQIFDKRYKSVLQGYDSIINLSSLRNGNYYLQIDTVKIWTIINKK